MFWSAALRAKTGLKLTAGMERQICLSFSPVCLVLLLPTRWLSQYPCPQTDLAAVLCNIYNAYILEQRSIGAISEMQRKEKKK
jgi:hypothetical protein